VGPTALARYRPPIINPGIWPQRKRPFERIYALAGDISRTVAGPSLSVKDLALMNYLSREKQIEIIAALCEGVGQRAVTRLTGCNRKTVARLALRVGRGCAELHDRLMVGIRVNRLELDEAWSFVGKKQKNVLRHEIPVKGDQYVFIGMAGTQKAIIGWRVGKRNADTTLEFLHDLRQRVIGQPEISTDGFLPYRNSIRDTFGDTASHGVIVKTYSVTHLVKEAQGRYSPAAVVAVSRDQRSRAIRFDQLR
jgi:IS1 family transposase